MKRMIKLAMVVGMGTFSMVGTGCMPMGGMMPAAMSAAGAPIGAIASSGGAPRPTGGPQPASVVKQPAQQVQIAPQMTAEEQRSWAETWTSDYTGYSQPQIYTYRPEMSLATVDQPKGKCGKSS